MGCGGSPVGWVETVPDEDKQRAEKHEHNVGLGKGLPWRHELADRTLNKSSNSQQHQDKDFRVQLKPPMQS